jgi:multidrug efflux pump subunit AcrB
MVGEQDFMLDASNKQGASESQLYVQCKNEPTLNSTIKSFNAYCLKNYPGAELKQTPPPTIFEKIFNKQDAPLSLRLTNKNGNELPSANEIKEISAKILAETTIPINNKLRLQHYFEIAPNYERLLLYEVSVNELVEVLKKALNQLQVFTLKQGQYQVPVFLTGADKDLFQIIRSTKVRAENKEMIPLSALVAINENTDYKVLQGSKSGIFTVLNYNVDAKDAEKIIDAANTVLKEYPTIEMEVKGSLLDNVSLFKEMSIILLVSILLLYFILAAQFESLLQPLIVLIEIPIDIAGALFILWAAGYSLNLMSLIGLIVMTGIIINDSILKIDTINRLVKNKIPIMEAIHLGGKRRLKPIIMTSATTILAMVPFLFGNDMGSKLQQPLAVTVIGGMFIGTLVSLYFIPLCYYFLMGNRK